MAAALLQPTCRTRANELRRSREQKERRRVWNRQKDRQRREARSARRLAEAPTHCAECGRQLPPHPKGRRRYCTGRRFGCRIRPVSLTHCAHCGKQLPPPKDGGQPRRYCDRTCSEAARLQRMTPEQREQRKAQRRGSRERNRETAARWWRDNRELQREYARRGKKLRMARDPVAERAKRQAYNQTRKGRKRKNGGSVAPNDWVRLVRRFNGLCAYCGVQPSTSMDHVIPLSRGGRHTIGNVLPTCVSCNSTKRNRLLIEWPRRPVTS
jgi:hypothetical protein